MKPLQCPFCRRHYAKVGFVTSTRRSGFYVACGSCCAGGPIAGDATPSTESSRAKATAKAIERWNRAKR